MIPIPKRFGKSEVVRDCHVIHPNEKNKGSFGMPLFPKIPVEKNNIFFKHVKQQKTSQEVWKHPTVNITYSSTLMVSKPF